MFFEGKKKKRNQYTKFRQTAHISFHMPQTAVADNGRACQIRAALKSAF